MLVGFLIGTLTSVVCAMVCRAWAHRRQVLRKVGTPLVEEARSLPPVGGLALALGCVAGTVAWALQGGIWWMDHLLGLAWAGAVMLVVGLIDDFVRELRPWQKLLGQGLAWLCLVRSGIVAEIFMLPSWANVVVSLLWTLGIINALNLLDITDGLAAGIGLIAAGTFLILSLLADQVAVAGLLAVLCGALLGVWMFNFPRATLFLGDSGSMVLGLWLAAFALAISYAPLGREVALLTPIVVLGLPIYDIAFVTVLRARNGRSVFKKSQDHFVFRLMRQGLSPTRAVLAMLGLCLAFSLAALVVSRASNVVGIATVGVVVMTSMWWGLRLGRAPSG